MSRRTGKAATRRARQQRRTKQGPNPAAAAPRPAVSEPSIPEEPRPPAPRPAAAPAWAATSSTSSRLGESARVEYHYVARDLRNTAVLVVIMGALLAAAVVAVNLAGFASQ
jgi:hypothetical protein